MSRPSLSRLSTLLLITVVALATLAVTVHAAQTITVPNETVVSYNLPSGANSGPITPVANQPVFVQGVQTAVGFRGVGHVSLLRVPGNFLEWVGLDSPFNAAITSGFSSSQGTHIVFLDFSHLVDIQVNSADTFRIHNANSNTQTGVVTLIW
jgi:hypothetical protein